MEAKQDEVPSAYVRAKEVQFDKNSSQLSDIEYMKLESNYRSELVNKMTEELKNIMENVQRIDGLIDERNEFLMNPVNHEIQSNELIMQIEEERGLLLRNKAKKMKKKARNLQQNISKIKDDLKNLYVEIENNTKKLNDQIKARQVINNTDVITSASKTCNIY